MPTRDTLVLNGQSLSAGDVVAVARDGRRVALGERAARAIGASRDVVERAARDAAPRYGINTGFGSLSRERIAPARLRELQTNLVRSHAAGVDGPLAQDVVRAMMLLLAASLARGCSGVRVVVVRTLLMMLNKGVTPVVPSIGSVGASGDLAPLAHLALVLIGEGRAWFDGRESTGARAMHAARVRPIALEAKEGLALINGTHLMAGQGALLLHDAARLQDAALVACAMSIDAARATDAFLDDRVHKARNQPGQRGVASSLRALLRGSTILPSHRSGDPRVQDPYSFRCAPQVLGAAFDSIDACRDAIERELGAVTDNPLVFAAGRGSIVSAGNFHGMALAIPLDSLAIALAHIAGIAERRTFWLLSAQDPHARLRPYLAPDPGVTSGLMIAQYTAAACCNEIIGLCTPASVANLSTSAGIEDYNSFGPRAAAKARRTLDLTRMVVAIELLCAVQGLEAHRPLSSGAGVEHARRVIRRRVAPLTADRPPTADIEAIAELIRDGDLARAGR